MERQGLIVRPKRADLSLTLRDVVVVGFRHRKVVAFCFLGVLLGAVASSTLWPKYEAETEILIRRERVDPVVTAQQASPMMVRDEISEEELNSEVELISSEDVLSNVVKAAGLDNSGAGWLGRSKNSGQEMAGAVRQHRPALNHEALPKTDIIRITYTSRKPEMAARVLDVLDSAYIQKHKELHHPMGQFSFFEQQTSKAKEELGNAESRLKEFPIHNPRSHPL